MLCTGARNVCLLGSAGHGRLRSEDCLRRRVGHARAWAIFQNVKLECEAPSKTSVSASHLHFALSCLVWPHTAPDPSIHCGTPLLLYLAQESALRKAPTKMTVLSSWLVLCAAAAAAFPTLEQQRPPLSARFSAERPAVSPLPRPDVDSFTYLNNGIIRLGIDMSRGGALGWLGPADNSSLSLLNIHDFGRVVQGSFYSGPPVFDPEGKCSEPGGWGR